MRRTTRNSPRWHEKDCGYETPCWVWAFFINSSGYGVLNAGRTTIRAHRAVYQELVGPIPEGLTLDHLCRNRACVNPAHLEPITRGDNVRRGIVTKLTAEDRAAIAESDEPAQALARRFGVSWGRVYAVRREMRGQAA